MLGLVAEPPSLLWASGLRDTDELVELTVLPGSHAEQEAHHIALLLAVDLLHVFVSPHCGAFLGPETEGRGDGCRQSEPRSQNTLKQP